MIEARTIATFVTRYRAKMGLTKQALADELGFTAQQVYSVESGKTKLPEEFCTHLMARLEPEDKRTLNELMNEAFIAQASKRRFLVVKTGKRKYS